MQAVAAAEVAHKDVIVSVLGASAGLGGLMLVFLGLLINVHQGFPADTPKAVKDRTRTASWRMFAIFASSIASVGVATTWLVIPGGDILYWIAIAIFGADLAAMVVGAAWTTKKLLR